MIKGFQRRSKGHFGEHHREGIARRIASNEGHLYPERMKWLVAMREYGANSMTRDLIRKALGHVHS